MNINGDRGASHADHQDRVSSYSDRRAQSSQAPGVELVTQLLQELLALLSKPRPAALRGDGTRHHTQLPQRWPRSDMRVGNCGYLSRALKHVAAAGHCRPARRRSTAHVCVVVIGVKVRHRRGGGS